LKKKVLIVDDSEDILDFLEFFLNRFKVPCVRAASGSEAIKLYDREEIDFVFLDIQLNDMSGFDVLNSLRKVNNAVKVIMITGKSEKDFENRARELSVLDYLIKPLDLGELKNALDKYVIGEEC
jgi:DNA-binding response OmpR family regulator